MGTKKVKKHSLGNPALVAAMASNPEVVKQASNGVKNLAKTILIVGGCAVGFLVGRKMWKKYKDKQEVADEAGSTKGATFSDEQAKVYANALYTAMKGLGTDEKAVKNVFSNCKNDADVNLIILKFGKQKDETLSQWINDDFSADGKEQYINSVLRANGCTKQF